MSQDWRVGPNHFYAIHVHVVLAMHMASQQFIPVQSSRLLNLITKTTSQCWQPFCSQRKIMCKENGVVNKDATQSTRCRCYDSDEPCALLWSIYDAIGTLKRLAKMTIRTIYGGNNDHCIVTNDRHPEVHILTQPNGWDCGYHVMQTIEMLVEEFIQGFESHTFVSMAWHVDCTKLL